MKRKELKHLIEEAVLKKLNESPAWDEVERKLNKWFTLSPKMSGNIKSLEVISEQQSLNESIVLNDKQGNKITLLSGASSGFVKRYMPLLSNMLSSLSGQSVNENSPDKIIFK